MKSSQFKRRMAKGQESARKLEHLLRQWGIHYAETGYEYWNQSEGFKKAVGPLNDPTSKLIRHFPDFSIVADFKNTSILIEVKGSSGIEKECYDHLVKIENDGHNVFICFDIEGSLKLIRPSKIKFNSPTRWVRKLQEEEGFVIPCEKHWMHPRRMCESDYKKYKQKMRGRTSGCSFAFIDFKRTDFKPIERLLEWIKPIQKRV